MWISILLPTAAFLLPVFFLHSEVFAGTQGQRGVRLKFHTLFLAPGHLVCEEFMRGGVYFFCGVGGVGADDIIVIKPAATNGKYIGNERKADPETAPEPCHPACSSPTESYLGKELKKELRNIHWMVLLLQV